MNSNKLKAFAIVIWALSFWPLPSWADSTPQSTPTESEAIAEKDEGLLGEIRYSILSPKQFETLYGPGWVLMDGRRIPGSELEQQFKWEKLPDARGVFLRAKTHNRKLMDAHGNPDGDLELGTYQPDQFAKHAHGIRLECGPTHSNATTCQPPGSQYNYVNGNGLYPHGSYSNTISETGGDETRPRNITVNVYVKINGTKKNKQSEETLAKITTEIKLLPEYLIKNRAFLKLMDKYIQDQMAKSK
jgi:hypothetical protein